MHEEEDDAPPIESLGDDSEMGEASFASASFRAGSGGRELGQSTTGNAASAAATSRSPTKEQADPAMRTVLVFGISRNLEAPILEQFSTFGAVESTDWISLSNSSGVSDGCLEVVYKESWAALRAVRRSGEIIGGIALVGVRWKDDNVHREMVLNGLSSTIFTSIGGAALNGAASSAIATSSVQSQSANNKAAPATSAGAAAGARGTPSRSQIGRPISVFGNKESIFAPSPSAAKGGNPLSQLRSAAFGSGTSSPTPSAPIAAPAQQKAAQAGTPQQSSGLLGRLNDAVFGW